MAKLTRKTQKIFSETSSENGQFGSGLVGTKVLSDDPDVLQALSAWLGGWTDATLGGQKLPPLEEMNGVQYVQTRQLAYLFEQGIPEYDAGTTYYEKSIVVESGTYNLYGSLTNNNVGNALSDDTNWEFVTSFKGNTIIDYTEVKKVGEVNQIMAGNDYTLTELEGYFSAANLISFNKFNSSDLGADETGNYDYTLGSGSAEPTNTNGIMGDNNAIVFDGVDDVASNTTKLNDMSTTFSSTGFIYSLWFKIPSTAIIFSLGKNFVFSLSITRESVSVNLFDSGGSGNNVSFRHENYSQPNNWAHIVVAADTTNGIRLFYNGFLVSTNKSYSSFSSSTANTYYIGYDGSLTYSPGTYANEVIIKKVCTQADVDFLFATKIGLPASLQNKDYSVEGFLKEKGEGKKTFNPNVAYLGSENVYIKGNSFQRNDNEIKLVGRL